MKTEKIIFAGFGGQGILSMGQLLAYAGMSEGKNVTWLPSYGPEMRGGTANCHVILSSQEIDSPIISKATIVVAMNLPSLKKFETYLEPGGILMLNSTMVRAKPKRGDVRVIKIPATQCAMDLGRDEIGNMVMLGALLVLIKTISEESMIASFGKVFESITPELKKLDIMALQRGRILVESIAETV